MNINNEYNEVIMNRIKNTFLIVSLLLVPLHLVASAPTPKPATTTTEEGEQSSSWKVPTFLLSKKVWAGVVGGGLVGTYALNSTVRNTVNGTAASTYGTVSDTVAAHPRKAMGFGAILTAFAGYLGYTLWNRTPEAKVVVTPSKTGKNLSPELEQELTLKQTLAREAEFAHRKKAMDADAEFAKAMLTREKQETIATSLRAAAVKAEGTAAFAEKQRAANQAQAQLAELLKLEAQLRQVAETAAKK